MGDHTDYNDGFVLPMAIQQSTVIAARPRSDRKLHAGAILLNRWTTVDLDQPVADASESWVNYIIGVVRELAAGNYPLNGADLIVTGSTPVGAGLSSSASLEMAALCLFETLGGFAIEGPEGPRLGQRVENDFLELSTGIMDQFISRMGKAGHVLFLDCRSFAFELVPVSFDDACFVIANTGVTRGLTASKYNERVAQCREAVAGMCNALGKNGAHLRDFTLEDLESAKKGLSDVAYRRARHVITEDARTRAACEAMRAGDAAELGRLMDASHESLRLDYEVTCPELDAMAEIACGLDDCFGSRMTGAGFGGCTVSLVEASRSTQFAERLAREYTTQTGLQGETIISAPADGATPITF